MATRKSKTKDQLPLTPPPRALRRLVLGIALHGSGLATIAFVAVFLSVAVPGVPRGAFIMLTPLFLAIGLPAEGIGILIALDAIPDTFSTALNVTGDLAAARWLGGSDGLKLSVECGGHAAALRH